MLSDRQTERLSSIALSADGRTLATGDEDGTIRLRDPETGRVVMNLRGHELDVLRLAFSPDGRRLASVGIHHRPPSLRGEVLLWEVESGQLLARLEGFSDRVVEQVAFDARGDRFWEISWTENGRCRLGCWDVSTDFSHPRLIWSRFTEDRGQSCAGDGPNAALEGPGPGFRLPDLEEAMGLGWTGAIDRGQLAAGSPDGRLLAVGIRTGVVLWDVMAGRERARYEHPREQVLVAIRFSPDSRYLTLVSASGRYEVRDLRTGAVRTIPADVVGTDPGGTQLAFSPDSRVLARNVSKTRPVLNPQGSGSSTRGARSPPILECPGVPSRCSRRTAGH